MCLSEPRAVHVWRYGEDVLFCKLPSPPCPAPLAVPSKSNSSTFFYRNELSLSKISKQQADNNVGSFFVHFRATRALQQLTIVLVLKAVATCLAAFFSDLCSSATREGVVWDIGANYEFHQRQCIDVKHCMAVQPCHGSKRLSASVLGILGRHHAPLNCSAASSLL